MIGRGLAIVVAILSSVATVRAEEVRFDGFFAGFLGGCEMNRAFGDFHGSLVRKYGVGGNRSTRVAIPADVAGGVGAASAKKLSDYTEVRVPLQGTFQGLRVGTLVFAIGNENGIRNWAVEFAEPASVVRDRLGSAVAASRRRVKAADTEGIGFDTGLDFKGRAALWCDQST